MDSVSEIKARLPIEDLVAEYCQLQRKGRTLKALCPFHNDTHPSFTVSPDKGIAYCFACQSGGDIFSFYQKIENVDFPQALRDLAEKTGVTLPKGKLPEGVKKDEKDRLRDCLEAAAVFFQAQLRAEEPAQLYLKERRVTDELIATFRIGYAPDSFDATYLHLLKEGFSRKEILGAGLGVQKDLQEERIYDRFRNRIIFPITDPQGGAIGFGGRTLGGEDAKYINSPDGPLYNKSAALFGLSLAREAIRQSRSVILVEGYFDVLACHRLGIRNVVAVSGTALTEQHASTLKRIADRVSLFLDADTAGKQAAERAFVTCVKRDLDVRSLSLPTGKDPDECAMHAPDALTKVCQSDGLPYLDCVLEEMKQTQAEKRDILGRMLPLLQAIPSAVLREECMEKLAKILGSSLTAVQDDVRAMQQRELSPRRPPDQHAVQPSLTSAELFLGLLLTFPQHRPLLDQLIAPEKKEEQMLFVALKEKKEGSDLPEQCRERAGFLQLYCEEQFSTLSESMLGKELRKLLRKVNRETLLAKQQLLLGGIKQARGTGKKIEEEQLLTQYQQVLKLSKLAS